MILIGLNGRLHSGKDTAFITIQELAAQDDKRARRVGFADKMKLSGVRALGFDPESMEAALDIANGIKEVAEIVVRYPEPFPDPKWRFWRRKPEFKETSITGREFWQRYGTEAHREVYGQEFHVDALLPRPTDGGRGILRDLVLEDAFDTDVLVVTDVRFANEARRVQQLGGQVWRIDADQRLGPLPDGAHPSEQGLPTNLVDAVIENNDDLPRFRTNIKEAWQSVV